MSGGVVFCEDPLQWDKMASLNVLKKRQNFKALRMVKKIGRGGPIKEFLNQVQPFTRTVRIVLAVARAWEAHVDNRLVEVGIAEAL